MSLSKKTPITYPSPEDFAGFLLWKTANSWEKTINTLLKNYKLTQPEYFHLVSLFYLLDTHPEVTQTGLASYTGTSLMNTSKILTKLERRNYITRQSGRDPRSKSLRLTSMGQKITVDVAQIMGQTNQQFFGEKYNQTLTNIFKNLPKL